MANHKNLFFLCFLIGLGLCSARRALLSSSESEAEVAAYGVNSGLSAGLGVGIGGGPGGGSGYGGGSGEGGGAGGHEKSLRSPQKSCGDCSSHINICLFQLKPNFEYLFCSTSF